MEDDFHLGDGATVRARPGQPARAPIGLRVTLDDGRVFSIEGTATVGRATRDGEARGVNVPLADATVSAFHVDLVARDDGILVKEVKHSLNGTWLRDVRVLEGVLPDGSVLRVGASALRVERLFGGDAASAGSVPPPTDAAFGELIGTAPAIQRVIFLLRRLAPTRMPILVLGPTGTGKELAARALHRESRRAGPLVVMDCTAVTVSLAEDTLFGHAQGAFSGAIKARPGLFEVAHGGTLFLDEVGDLPAEIQPKLLRALESRTVTRVGETATRSVDVRIVAATWKDLRALVNQGTFREDLYHRIAGAIIALPSLDERRGDVPALVRRMLDGLAESTAVRRDVTPEVMSALCERDYPGNVRELRNLVELLHGVAEGAWITADDLDTAAMCLQGTLPAAAPTPTRADRGEAARWKEHKAQHLEGIERAYFSNLLDRVSGNLSAGAGVADVDRNHLRTICQRHGLLPWRPRATAADEE